MNYGSVEQQRAVAGNCKHFNNKSIDITDREVMCGICKNWDGAKCKIGVFDKVLTSLDQT